MLMLVDSTLLMAATGQDNLRKGLDYVAQDNYPMAMKYFTKSMETAEQEGDQRTLAKSMGYVGNVYYNLYDYARCLQYQLKGYEIARKTDDRHMQGNFLINIVATYCKQKNSAKAHEYFKMLEQMPAPDDNLRFRYFLIYNRARIAALDGNLPDALAYHKEALEYAVKNKMDSVFQFYQYCEMGQLYSADGNYTDALRCAKICEKGAAGGGTRDLMTSVYLLLADSYGGLGNTEEEMQYRTKYFALSDSLFNRKYVSQADHDLMEYETRRTSEQIHSLNHVINYQLAAIVASSVFVVVLAMMLFLLWRNNRKLRSVRLVLLERNRELQQQDDNARSLLEQLTNEKEQQLQSAAEESAAQTADAQETTSETAAGATTDAPEDTREKAAGEARQGDALLSKEQANLLLRRIVKVMGDISVISDPDFSLNMLAEAVGSNTRYVSWVINDTYNKNFKNLLNEHRIREACRRLSDSEHYGNVTIQAIYESVGYTNAVSFIRAFRKINGMTPSEYQSLVAEQRAAGAS